MTYNIDQMTNDWSLFAVGKQKLKNFFNARKVTGEMQDFSNIQNVKDFLEHFVTIEISHKLDLLKINTTLLKLTQKGVGYFSDILFSLVESSQTSHLFLKDLFSHKKKEKTLKSTDNYKNSLIKL